MDNDKFQSNQHNQQNIPQDPVNHFTIHRIHDFPTSRRKTQLSLPYSDLRDCLSMAERGRVVGGHCHHLQGKRYKVQTLADKEETEKSVGGCEATIRPGKAREREHRRDGMRDSGDIVDRPMAMTKDGQW